MARIREALLAVAVLAGGAGCATFCDECDNFPIPGGPQHFEMMPGSYTGPPVNAAPDLGPGGSPAPAEAAPSLPTPPSPGAGAGESEPAPEAARSVPTPPAQPPASAPAPEAVPAAPGPAAAAPETIQPFNSPAPR